jgi:hypothetical protein
MMPAMVPFSPSALLHDLAPAFPGIGGVPDTDAALHALLQGRVVETLPDVIDLMTRIDALLPEGDGLKAFNRLYRMVTQAIGAASEWEDTGWIVRLDVIFAELYFGGVDACLLEPDAAPGVWRVLMDRRHRRGISAVQFALAGMNAHIDRDLALAVARTWIAMGTADHGRSTPQFRDYQRVDHVLDAVEPGAMRVLATGLLAVVDDILAPADAWAAMSLIHAARDLAWTNAQSLSALGLDTDDARDYLRSLDVVAANGSLAALTTLG